MGKGEETRTKVVKWAMVKRASQVHKSEHMEVDMLNVMTKKKECKK